MSLPGGTGWWEGLSAIVSAGANVELTPDDLREIDVAASAITVRGDRYSEGSQKMIDR